MPLPPPVWDQVSLTLISSCCCSKAAGSGITRSSCQPYLAVLPCSADVQAAAQQQLEKLYGSQAKRAGFQYLAVHMRLGGMEQEKWLRSSKVSRNGPLVDLVHGITCIKKLGKLWDKVGAQQITNFAASYNTCTGAGLIMLASALV